MVGSALTTSHQRVISKMTRARPTLFQTNFAVMCIARQRAKKAVIVNIRAKGRKLQEFTAAQVLQMSGDYLMQHFELIEEAKLICAELHLRELHHKREHARLRRAQIKTFARQRRYLFVCFVLHKAFFQIDRGRGAKLGLWRQRRTPAQIL
jgi:hypothetical protein